MAALKYPLLSESAVNLIITQVQNQFNSALQDVDNQYTDGISLEPLSNENIYISNQFQTLVTPAVYILFSEHAFQYSENPNFLISNDKCMVVVSAEDIGADVLTKKMWRYARVIFECLNLQSLNSTDGRLEIKCVPDRLGYTQPIKDLLNPKTGKFRMDCVLELTLQHFEKELV